MRLSFDQSAFILRIGLGLVFLAGGLAKLSKLLVPAKQGEMVNLYLSPGGYINQFFFDYLFHDGILSGLMSPWLFLTALSMLELIAGIALLIGLGVKFFSLLFAFLAWSFVISLPVVNASGFEVVTKTHTAPAILVMIRDIALSGLLITLYNLGPGVWSVDEKIFGPQVKAKEVNWDALGLLVRVSLALVFIVGGAFYGLENIKSFALPIILLPIGVVLLFGNGVRYAGVAAMLVIAWYMLSTFSFDKDLVANMNSVKREFALLASALMLAGLGGGSSHTLFSMLEDIRTSFAQSALLRKV
jgi:uncharacterized membrane protein YphA (DoxX/SURF4 family)